MVKRSPGTPRRNEALSRERIVEASIELLDSSGEEGLTFRALSERLSTGPGAIYWHVSSKNELIVAACDAVVAQTMVASLKVSVADGGKPKAIIRRLALGMFDAMDAHPWVGSALTRAPGLMPMVRIFEPIGQQIGALGVSENKQWAAVSALLNYILGVGGQNAANGQLARTQGTDRADFLEAVSTVWSQLDRAEYPFARSIAGQLRAHDDRTDYLAGIDLILRGIEAKR